MNKAPRDNSFRPGSPAWERVENEWASWTKTRREMFARTEDQTRRAKEDLLDVYDQE